MRRELLAARHRGGVLAGSGGHPAQASVRRVEQDEAVWRRRRRWTYAAFALGLRSSSPGSASPPTASAWPRWRPASSASACSARAGAAWGRMLLDWLPFQARAAGLRLQPRLRLPLHRRADGRPRLPDPRRAQRARPAAPGATRRSTSTSGWPACSAIGTTPTQWLQTHLHPGPVDGTAIPWFAVLVSLVYCSHYLVMPVTAVVTVDPRPARSSGSGCRWW